jgi:hypothetical protein
MGRDSVISYFGMRKIALGKDADGIQRLMLNNKPLFQFGPLDQGFWPDGLYTAPTDAALKSDIEVTKEDLKIKSGKVNKTEAHIHERDFMSTSGAQ